MRGRREVAKPDQSLDDGPAHQTVGHDRDVAAHLQRQRGDLRPRTGHTRVKLVPRFPLGRHIVRRKDVIRTLRIRATPQDAEVSFAKFGQKVHRSGGGSADLFRRYARTSKITRDNGLDPIARKPDRESRGLPHPVFGERGIRQLNDARSVRDRLAVPDEQNGSRRNGSLH